MIAIEEEDMTTMAANPYRVKKLQDGWLGPFVDIVTFAFERIDELDPSQPIYIDANNRHNCILAGDVRAEVKRISAGLVAHGLKVGDCVCIHSFNSIWYPLLWLAVIASGGIASGSNPSYTSTELAHHFKITNAKFVIAQAECVDAVKEAVLNDDALSVNLLVLGNGRLTSIAERDVLYEEIRCYDVRKNILHFDNKEKQANAVAVYATTSGTTGLPKAAEISHKYLVAQVTNIERVFLTRKGQIRQLMCLPVFHAFAAQLAIVLPLRLGVSTFFMPRFNLKPYLHHVQEFQITDLAVVPPIVSALTSVPAGPLDSVRYILCAGAPMTASVQSKLYSSLNPAATIAQCWGLTELGWITLFDHSECDKSGSVGRLLPNTELKIVDENDDIVIGDNIPGEARIKSASMMLRYHKMANSDEDPFDRDGYYCTGDCVYTQEGRVFITGRIKDILKVNGWQVSPEEIQKVILELKFVEDCAVVGHTVIDEATGLENTKPRAFVVLKSASHLTADDVKDHVASRLVRYKRLTGGVFFTDTIPRSNTGKILRRKLLEPSNEDPIHGHQGLHEHSAQDISDAEENYNAVNPDDEHLNGHDVDTDELGVTYARWSLYFFMITLLPLCFGLGLPGLILLCVGMKQIVKRRSG